MLWFMLSILLAISAGVTAFLFLVSGDLEHFKKRFTVYSIPVPLPIITKDGQILDSKEDIETQLTTLQVKLESKQSELVTSKSRIITAAESIQKLTSTSEQVRRYYLKLKNEIERSERNCLSLQEEIDEYKIKREQLCQLASTKNNHLGDNFLKTVVQEMQKGRTPNMTSTDTIKTYTASMDSNFFPDL